MSDLNLIQKAIDDSTKAFDEFKSINDKRLALVEQNRGGADDLKASMEKAFADMAEQKTIIETLEAKLNRPHLGADGKVIDKPQEEHKAGFASYMRKGKEDGLSALESKALAYSTSAGADGGYAVPKVIDQLIESQLINISPIRGLANVVQISTNDYYKLVNLRGTASGWVGEVAARPATGTPTLAQVKPPMGELYCNPQATQQSLDDIFFNVESWLASEIATEFARAEGAAFITGNGTNMPAGFLNSTYVATDDGARANASLQYVPTGVAGGFAASNPADILFSLVSKLKAGYRQGASFAMNKATLFTIASFKDSSGRYIFTPVTAPGVPQTLLGYGVTEAEDMPTIGTGTLSIAFGNFKNGYEIVDRMGTRVIRDPFSNKPYVGFYTTRRVGGAVINSEAIKAVKFSIS